MACCTSSTDTSIMPFEETCRLSVCLENLDYSHYLHSVSSSIGRDYFGVASKGLIFFQKSVGIQFEL